MFTYQNNQPKGMPTHNRSKKQEQKTATAPAVGLISFIVAGQPTIKTERERIACPENGVFRC